MARVEFSPENYDLLKFGMLVWCCWVAVNGTLFTLEMSYWGVARLDSILGGQKNIDIFGDFFFPHCAILSMILKYTYNCH